MTVEYLGRYAWQSSWKRTLKLTQWSSEKHMYTSTICIWRYLNHDNLQKTHGQVLRRTGQIMRRDHRGIIIEWKVQVDNPKCIRKQVPEQKFTCKLLYPVLTKGLKIAFLPFWKYSYSSKPLYQQSIRLVQNHLWFLPLKAEKKKRLLHQPNNTFQILKGNKKIIKRILIQAVQIYKFSLCSAFHLSYSILYSP